MITCFDKYMASPVQLQLSLSSAFFTHTRLAQLAYRVLFHSSLKSEREVQNGSSAQVKIGKMGQRGQK